VLDAVDVSLAFGERKILRKLTWRLGPGDRFALVGVNGSGKTTLMNVLAGELPPDSGVVERGQTVNLAHLTQDAAEIPGHLSVREALEEVRGFGRLSSGGEQSAATLLDRFGFRGDRQRSLVSTLSGGELRRLQLMRLLMGEPNVLLLDEPTNDLDIDTLNALEDLLDHWPGTLVIVSHDRYFVERVCDNVYALDGLGGIRHVPRGIDQYVDELRQDEPPPPAPRAERERPTGAVVRDARKEVARLERTMEKLDEREAALHEAMASAATDHVKLRELGEQLDALRAQRDEAESAWLEQSALLEG
jgi:ATP-binding cassette subfamily F protein uup